MPHLTIGDVSPAELEALFDSSDHKMEQRRQNLRNRFLIESEAHGALLANRIVEVYKSPHAKAEIQKYASKTINVQRRVTDEVAAPLYRWPPARFIEGASKKKNKDWAEVLDEGRIKIKAKQWGRYAFIGNVIFILPVVREYNGEKKLRFETILPHDAGLVWTQDDDVDPDTPSILVYKVDDADTPTSEELRFLTHDEKARREAALANKVIYKAVDAEGWWGLNHKFARIRRYETWNHGIPPFVQFRVTEPPPWDYWDTYRGDRLPEATLEAGRIQASMLWIRKEQHRKLLVLQASSSDNVQDGGSASPESTVNLWGDANEVSLKTIDYETKPDAFFADINHQVETALESYGIPVGTVHLAEGSAAANSDLNQLKLAANYALISLVRDDQIANVENCEADLQWKIALQLHAGKHPKASSFKPDDVKKKARTVFPPTTFADHPLQRAEIYRKKIELGLMRHADALMEEYPGRWTSREAAHEELLSNIEVRNEVAMLLAEHNTSKDPTEDMDEMEEALADQPPPGKEFQTRAQVQGARGGMKSKPPSRSDDRE